VHELHQHLYDELLQLHRMSGARRTMDEGGEYRDDAWVPPEVRSVLREDERLFEIFHENTKLTLLVEGQTAEKFGEIYQSPRTARMVAHAQTRVSSRRVLELPEPAAVEANLSDAIASRRSVRQFDGSPLSLGRLSALLQLAAGVTGKTTGAHRTTLRLRAAASGGALYPVETYLIANAVEDLRACGVYHYLPYEHGLEDTARDAPIELQIPWFPGAEPDSVRRAAAVVVLTGVFLRSTYKYGDRGYRAVLFEAGGIAAHLNLVAHALGLGSYQLSGFYDDNVNDLLDLDGCNEAALNLVMLGGGQEVQ